MAYNEISIPDRYLHILLAIMSSTPDIRWHQRYQSFTKALARLTAGVELADERPLSELE